MGRCTKQRNQRKYHDTTKLIPPVLARDPNWKRYPDLEGEHCEQEAGGSPLPALDGGGRGEADREGIARTILSPDGGMSPQLRWSETISGDRDK